MHRRHPLAAALAVWSRLPGLTRVDLGPLPDADLRRIVRRAGAGLSDDLVERVARRAEGNAFFAEELAAAAGDRGGADPADLARLLLTRVDRLDDGSPGRGAGRRRHRPPRAARRCSSASPGSMP